MQNCFHMMGLILFLALLIDPAQGQMEPVKLVPFDAFLQSVKDAKAEDFLSRPASKVKDAASFEEMRRYLLSLYDQVRVKHSYLLGSQTFDCVPVEQQPSVRASGTDRTASEPPAAARSQGSAALITDKLGSALGCQGRTIPMRRVTLEQLSRFGTLKEFLGKGPNSGGHALK